MTSSTRSLEVTFFGTRGTIPAAGEEVKKYGGNTTCLRIDSPCIPQGTWLVIDAGNGLLPLTREGLKAGVKEVKLLFTHYHHDHTIGLPIAAWVHIKAIPMHIWGPKISPAKVIKTLMERPLFPVSYEQVASHLTCKAIANPPGMIFAIHPQGGMKLFRLDELERAEQSNQAQLPFGFGLRYNVSECLIIRMQQTDHPDYTISYRFEERPTRKVFVFATDHENQSATPVGLRTHFKGADLLVADCQYSDALYQQRAGYGHGSPSHCVKIAVEAEARRLGITHHDPDATDANIDAMELTIREEARKQGFPGDVFACADYMKVTV